MSKVFVLDIPAETALLFVVYQIILVTPRAFDPFEPHHLRLSEVVRDPVDINIVTGYLENFVVKAVNYILGYPVIEKVITNIWPVNI